MTWEELNKKYEKTKKKNKAGTKARNWASLMESTNKLIWMYMMNNRKGPESAESNLN